MALSEPVRVALGEAGDLLERARQALLLALSDEVGRLVAGLIRSMRR